MNSAQRIVFGMSRLLFFRATRGRHHQLSHFVEESGTAYFSRFDGDSAGTAADRKSSSRLPAWNALYQVRDFSYRVRDVEAHAAKSPSLTLPVQLLDKQTMEDFIARHVDPRSAMVDYSIEWDDAGPFNSQLNQHHAFVNFAEVLMYVPRPPRGGDAGAV